MKHRLEISAFSSGAIVMIFEILGSRILGSYVGTSIYVWTNIIALILGALALGYYVGGKLSDRGVSIIQVGFLFSISGLLFAILPLIKDRILIILSENIGDIRVSSFIATLILFTPASFILGMIHTYMYKNTYKRYGKLLKKYWNHMKYRNYMKYYRYYGCMIYSYSFFWD